VSASTLLAARNYLMFSIGFVQQVDLSNDDQRLPWALISSIVILPMNCRAAVLSRWLSSFAASHS
jgi:hypothetical protein